ncbi:quinone-interacting membrane-bound oxidoreductase complex subunit C [Desulfonatronospira thiodismutans ASO3-1]|uniref:Quinone-interacting membrane-bound oxidoreductase complex subunit C n=1 Tax=Desulfonatronospira thiodismutans ASO3-1 TaxID=555779 RepID=D6SNE6_9BACT|nr:quinone-interacting membrane-bound oxidoreductase complex subunit QmoC [Desulfonatronospira thiodismutans]EFI34272.1 quinone-interacting membrane-bound oxidoreductase complex subunit C [Desulfonatronospira thiodismutans ASO3-1]
MSTRIDPDVQFIREMQAAGGESLKKCYQCATCSVICPLSPEETPFPRKEMVWAQWGMKDKLVNDIDIWLCHNCGECSDYCPRGAKPGDLLAALRNTAYKSLARPAILGEWMSSAKYLPVLFAIPAILFLIVWAITTGLTIPDGEIVFSKVFPTLQAIDPIFILTVIFVVFTFIYSVGRMLSSFKEAGYVPQEGSPSLLRSLYDVIKEQILTHVKFKDCETNQERYTGHLLVFYGFVGLFLVTAFVATAYWMNIFGIVDFATPMAMWNPVKIFANIAGIALIVGLVYMTRMRLNIDPKKTVNSFYDWYLLGVIWAVVITGFLAQIFRLADAAALAYIVYYLHLVTVFMLFAYLPWSKLAHLVYRTVALAYARQIGRKGLSE